MHAEFGGRLPGKGLYIRTSLGSPPYLAAMARRPNITVQLIPREEAHVGLQGAFDMAQTPDALVAQVDHVAHIPIQSQSLNAAMAATVALYELSHRIPRA